MIECDTVARLTRRPGGLAGMAGHAPAAVTVHERRAACGTEG